MILAVQLEDLWLKNSDILIHAVIRCSHQNGDHVRRCSLCSSQIHSTVPVGFSNDTDENHPACISREMTRIIRSVVFAVH